MRVHDVVPAGLVAGLGAQHPRGEGAQLAGQVVLAQPLERPRDDVAHQHARRQLRDRRVLRRRRPREDLDLDAAAGHPQRGLHDVDVHPARVARARLLQRRGVHRQQAHPPDACPAPSRGRGTAGITTLGTTPSRLQPGSDRADAASTASRHAPGRRRASDRRRPARSAPGAGPVSAGAARPTARRGTTARRSGTGTPRVSQVTTTSGSARPRHGPSRAGDLAVHDLRRGRQVEQVGQRARVAADDHLARRAAPRPATGASRTTASVDVGDRPSSTRTRSGGSRSAGSTRPSTTAAASARVGVGDERDVRAAVRVGEAGEQVGGVAGIGDGEVGAHPDGGEHGVVGGRSRAAGRTGPRGPSPTAGARSRAGGRAAGRAGPATTPCTSRERARRHGSPAAPASRARAAGQASSRTRSRSRTATAPRPGRQLVEPALDVVQAELGSARGVGLDDREPVDDADRDEHLPRRPLAATRGRAPPAARRRRAAGAVRRRPASARPRGPARRRRR